MTPERLLELLKIERECIKRNSIPFGCDRRCGECDLVQDTDELLEMYDTLIVDQKKRIAKIEEIKTDIVETKKWLKKAKLQLEKANKENEIIKQLFREGKLRKPF